MKKLILFLILLLFLIAFNVNAHPGGTDSSGCHTCRTNCSSWGLSYGEYHCHNATSSYQPLYPITSTWGSNGTGYTTPAPEYTYPSVSYPVIPSCPFNSSYSYLSETCKCNSGYTANSSGSSCISMDSYCEDLYGWNAEYDSLYDKCECGYGYLFDKGLLGDIQCIDGDYYCHDLYGYNSDFNSLTEECECDYGYYFDGDECVYKNSSSGSADYSYLSDLLDDYEGYNNQTACPSNSSKDSDEKCYCNTGYKINSDKDGCIKILCWENSILIDDECVCNDGYAKRDNVCIAHTENCKTTYGENVYGTTNNNGGSSCYCSDGHEWNSTTTQCVEKEIASQTIVQPPFEGKVLGESTSAFIEKEKEFVVEVDNVLTERLKGRILLQIEEHGEAWYVNPKDSKKYYMADGNEAYRIMRYLGVGITNKDLERVKVDKEFAKIHSGKIFLQVEANGEAFYIDVDGNNHYLKDGAYAYEAMRNLGLGITNNDLRKIDISEI